MFPDVWAYVSQIDMPLPSSSHAPSIWYEDLATPQWKPSGNERPLTPPRLGGSGRADAGAGGGRRLGRGEGGRFHVRPLAHVVAREEDLPVDPGLQRGLHAGSAGDGVRDR